jgi:hypothetical protein
LAAAVLGLAALVPAAQAQGEPQRREATEAQAFIADFLEQGYLQAWFAYPDNIRRHFADPVQSYWGRRDVPLSAVVQDKVAYARKWTFRFYRLVPESLDVKPLAGKPGTYQVTFDYEFLADKVPGKSSGIAQTTLTMALDGERVTILAEDGRVLSRR